MTTIVLLCHSLIEITCLWHLFLIFFYYLNFFFIGVFADLISDVIFTNLHDINKYLVGNKSIK